MVSTKIKPMLIKISQMGPLSNNGYIVMCPTTKEGVIVDAPAEPEKLLNALERAGTRIKAIIITHSHSDHIAGLEEIRLVTGAPVLAQKDDAMDLTQVDSILDDGQTITIGRVSLDAIHTPGHTPGSICLLTAGHILTGDTLFPGGPGATSTPEQFQRELRSITSKLLVLPEDIVVCPGHGDNTTIGKAKEEYTVFASRKQSSALCGNVMWLAS